jgi:hypothetical protein
VEFEGHCDGVVCNGPRCLGWTFRPWAETISGRIVWNAAAAEASELGEQCRQRRVGTGLNLSAQPLEDMRPPFRQVRNMRRETAWMQCESKYVDWRLQQRRVAYTGQKRTDGIVGHNYMPMPVHSQGWIWPMCTQDGIDYSSGASHGVAFDRALSINRCETGGDQQSVPIA